MIPSARLDDGRQVLAASRSERFLITLKVITVTHENVNGAFWIFVCRLCGQESARIGM
jgi:hypothetical protein